MPDSGVALANVAVARANSTRAGAGHGGGDGALAFLCADAECQVTLAPAGVAKLTGGQVADLPRDPVSGLRRWTVALPGVQVEFAEPCEQPELLWGVSGDESTLSFARNRAIVFRDAEGRWRCSDLSVRRLVFLHPRYAPLVVEVSDAQREGSEPLRLVLRAGSALRVDLVRNAPAASNVRISQRSALLPGHTIVYEAQNVFAKGMPANMQPQDPVSLLALGAGEWEITIAGSLWIPGKPHRGFAWTESIVVDGASAVTVTEGMGAGK